MGVIDLSPVRERHQWCMPGFNRTGMEYDNAQDAIGVRDRVFHFLLIRRRWILVQINL